MASLTGFFVEVLVVLLLLLEILLMLEFVQLHPLLILPLQGVSIPLRSLCGGEDPSREGQPEDRACDGAE